MKRFERIERAFAAAAFAEAGEFEAARKMEKGNCRGDGRRGKCRPGAMRPGLPGRYGRGGEAHSHAR
ncbi:MAG: hypothetical protein Kow0025_05840 [Thermodesulfovibrionales bacterium]